MEFGADLVIPDLCLHIQRVLQKRPFLFSNDYKSTDCNNFG